MKTKLSDALRKISESKFFPQIGLMLALLCSVGLFFYWSQYKTMGFCDEIYSYFTANSEDGVGVHFEPGTWYTKEDVISDFAAEKGFDPVTMLKNVYYDEHPPIYFTVFHVISCLWGMHVSKYVGLSVNFLCLIFLVIGAYSLLYRILKKPMVAAFGTVALVSAPGLITNLMLVRMYYMMCTWAIWYLYVMYRLMCEKDTLTKKQRIVFRVMICLLTVGGFLTHYYFAVYAVCFAFFYGIDCLRKKEIRPLLWHGAVSIIAVGIATALWPRWPKHMFGGYAGKEVLSTALDFKGMFLEVWKAITTWIPEAVFSRYVAPAGCVILLGCLYLTWKKKNPCMPFILVNLCSSFLYCIICQHVTPVYYVSQRYFYIATVTAYISIVILLVEGAKILAEGLFSSGLFKDGTSSSLRSRVCVLLFLVVIIFNTNMTKDPSVGGYMDITRKQLDYEYFLQHDFAKTPVVVYGYENWTMMQAYFTFAGMDRWILYNDQVDFPKGQAPVDGPFLLFVENRIYGKTEDLSLDPRYTLDWVLEHVSNLNGEKSYKVTYLFEYGMPVYMVEPVE
ncbi:MAG: glycosyltransferase family 39 protein [Lachnospiraceae bacterium]|nr:glycosyltransferase family 39 protein [Lachnospiraceae bacterium]